MLKTNDEGWDPMTEVRDQWQRLVEPNDEGSNPMAEVGTQRQRLKTNGKEWNPTAEARAQQWKLEPQRQSVEPNSGDWNPTTKGGGRGLASAPFFKLSLHTLDTYLRRVSPSLRIYYNLHNVCDPPKRC